MTLELSVEARGYHILIPASNRIRRWIPPVVGSPEIS